MAEHELDEPLDINPPRETEVCVKTQEGLRRSQRTRRLTEKGQELLESKSKRFQQHFTISYNKWKAFAKEARRALHLTPSSEILEDLKTKVHGASVDVKQAYEDLRQCITPDGEIRRRVDTCDAVSRHILDSLEEKCKGQDFHKEQEHQLEISSVLSSAISKGSSSCFQGSRSAKGASMRSRHSSRSSLKKQEAAAELAATQATLKVLQEMEREKQELENLEAENRQQLALQQAENALRQNALDEKRRQIEHLETVKKMNAAKARLEVYEQASSSDEDISELLHDSMFRQGKPVPKPKGSQVHHVAPPQNDTQVQPAIMP